MKAIYISSRLAPASVDFLRNVAAAARTPHEAELMLKNHVPERLILRQDGEVSIHAPSIDAASGPLGHLGKCLGRIVG